MTLPPFLLERHFAAHEFSVRHLLSSSDCEAMSIGALLDLKPGARAAFEETWLGYTESAGAPELRAAIAGIYASTKADQILVHTGAEEAIFSFMNAVLAPGDHLIVHEPSYQSLYAVAASRGIGVSRWQAREADGWALDPDDLAGLITEQTKAVVMNVPHNPTGYLMDMDRLERVIKLCRHHGLILFSDEVYRELEHDPADRLPAVCDVYERGVSLGVLSKTYGLAGLRIGWIATQNADVLTHMAAYKDYLTICNSAPSEFLATLALEHRVTLADRNRRLVMDNLDRADAFFARHAGLFHWQRPKAGSIAFPRLVQGDADIFCNRVLKEAGVLLLSSTLFEYGNDHVRFGFGRASFGDALGALDDVLAGVSV